MLRAGPFPFYLFKVNLHFQYCNSIIISLLERNALPPKIDFTLYLVFVEYFGFLFV